MAVLITRPKQVQGNLQQALAKAGIDYRWFPALELQPQSSEILHRQYDAAVVISPYAAEQALKQSPNLIGNIEKFYTVGEATANVLRAAGADNIEFPRGTANADNLLAMPSLQNTAEQKILVVKGEGGNPNITQTLTQRLAQVQEAILYRRSQNKNSQDLQQLESWLKQDEIHASIITSVEIIRAVATLNESIFRQLTVFPLIVSSSRIAKIADEVGFKNVHIANSALAACLIVAIKELESSSLSQ